mmetsp:Transcript_18366/g.38512  ORF Transcript_18366/g.38512 Transcript_18366/m.38512 type:complete len:94 (+) Transcript_18366:290-571(+)
MQNRLYLFPLLSSLSNVASAKITNAATSDICCNRSITMDTAILPITCSYDDNIAAYKCGSAYVFAHNEGWVGAGGQATNKKMVVRSALCFEST